MIEITSTKNDIVKHLLLLTGSREYRYTAGQFVVEGVKMVSECISAGYKIAGLFISRQKLSQYEELAGHAESAYIVSDAIITKLSDTVTPQGIIASVYMRSNAESPQGNILILDGIRDPGNMGAIIRTAAAADYGRIYLHSCVDPYNPKAVRSSMSGIFYVNATETTLEELSGLKHGRLFILADMQGQDMYTIALPDKPFALILGGEADGASEQVKALADAAVSIPMTGMESLNAAVSAGILMYRLKQIQTDNNRRL